MSLGCDGSGRHCARTFPTAGESAYVDQLAEGDSIRSGLSEHGHVEDCGAWLDG